MRYTIIILNPNLPDPLKRIYGVYIGVAQKPCLKLYTLTKHIFFFNQKILNYISDVAFRTLIVKQIQILCVNQGKYPAKRPKLPPPYSALTCPIDEAFSALNEAAPEDSG